MACSPITPCNITSFTPFESLSVIRQQRGIPMLFGYRDNLGHDKAGKPTQNTERRTKVGQIGRYAFDIYNYYQDSNINQYCLPTSQYNSNVSTFYGANLLKSLSYSAGNAVKWVYTLGEYSNISTNNLLTPLQKRDQFIDLIYTGISNVINVDKYGYKTHQFFLANEVYQYDAYDKATDKWSWSPRTWNNHYYGDMLFSNSVVLHSGCNAITDMDIFMEERDKYNATLCKATFDAFPNIPNRKFIFLGSGTMEYNYIQLKHHIDKARYINCVHSNLVHGFMIQGHFITNSALRQIEISFNILRNEKYEININECDSYLYDTRNTQVINNLTSTVTRAGIYTPSNVTLLSNQATLYSNYIHICLNQGVSHFQIWGESDQESWGDYNIYTQKKLGSVWVPISNGDIISDYTMDDLAIEKQKMYSTFFDKDLNPKPCYTAVAQLLKKYNVADFNSKKSIFSPYSVMNCNYASLESLIPK